MFRGPFLIKEGIYSMSFLDRRAKKAVDQIIHPRWRPYDKGLEEAERHGDLLDADFMDMDETEEVFPLESGRYVSLRHLACPPQYARDDGKKRVILMVHGHNCNSYYGLKYARIYYELGYETIIYDQRGHGNAELYPCTMGWLEAEDLECIANRLREDYGEEAIIGVHGESMGTATICMAMPKIAKTLNFAVCDCGYDELMRVIRDKAHSKKLTALVDKYSEVDGVKFSDIRPIDRVAQTPEDFPVYFIHGEGDHLISPKATQAMFNAKPGVKDATFYPLASHAHSINLYPVHYRRNVRIFLANHVEEGPQEG